MGMRDHTSLRLTRLAAAIAACAALALGLAASSTASSEVGVTIVSRAYQPPALTIEAGQTVTWTNRGFTPHTVTALGGEFGSGRLNVGESFKVTFSTPGTFAYKCEIHPSMRGTVTVLAPGAASSPGPLGPAQAVRLGLARGRGARGPPQPVHREGARRAWPAHARARRGGASGRSRRARAALAEGVVLARRRSRAPERARQG